MKTMILLILIGNISLAVGQQGPTVECFNCEGAMSAPLPSNGSWYNPDQPGTGYLLEVQNGRLLGYYFGYGTEGEQQWLIFQGELERPTETESDVLWQVNANFTSFSNGNAFNQPHVSPVNEQSGDAIFIEFISKHNARISVNGAEHQNFIPLVYGVGLFRRFEETEHLFPQLEGLWSFVYKRHSPETISIQHLYFTDIYGIDEGPPFFEGETKFQQYFITKSFPYPPFEGLTYGSILCSNPILPESGEREVICELIGFPAEPLGSQYSPYPMVVPLGDLGAFHFTAELIDSGGLPEQGFTIEATRVNYIGLENGDSE